MALLVHHRREAARFRAEAHRGAARAGAIARDGPWRGSCTAASGGRSARRRRRRVHLRRTHPRHATVLASAGAGSAAESRAPVAALPESRPDDPSKAPAPPPEKADPTPAAGAPSPPAAQPGPPVPIPPPIGPAVRAGSPRSSLPRASPRARRRSRTRREPAEEGRAQGRTDVATAPASAAVTVDPQPVAAATGRHGGPRRARDRAALALAGGDRAADPGGGRQDAARKRPVGWPSSSRTSGRSATTIAGSSWTTCGGSSRPPARKRGGDRRTLREGRPRRGPGEARAGLPDHRDGAVLATDQGPPSPRAGRLGEHHPGLSGQRDRQEPRAHATARATATTSGSRRPNGC